MCTWRGNYFETDEFFATALHLLAIIQIPIDIFGTYIVVFKTPPNLRKVKVTMLVLHLTCCWIDLFFNLLAVPYTIAPAAVGWPMGLLPKIGVPTSYVVYFGISSVALLGPALVLFFEDRYNRLVRQDSESTSRKIKRLVHFGLLYLFAFTCVLPGFVDMPSMNEAKEHLFNTFPCLPRDIVGKPGFFMLIEDVGVMMGSLLLFLFFSTAQIHYFAVKIMKYLSKTRMKSQKTSEMQKKLFKALSIQAIVPFVAILIPVVYLALSGVFHYLDMIYNNISIIWLATHSIWSTITMLCFHKGYREASLEVLLLKRKVSVLPFPVHSVTKL